jgi:CubicO group peptidase (beta-lactamase class C family)
MQLCSHHSQVQSFSVNLKREKVNPDTTRNQTMRLLLAVLATCTVAVLAYDFTAAIQVLEEAVTNRIFPGAVAVVGTATEGLLLAQGVGNYVYAGDANPPRNTSNPAVDATTLWDMASCTKVMATTTAAMQLVARGLLDIDKPLSDASLLGEAWSVNGKGAITARHLLLHNSGLPIDPDPFWSDPGFPCPEAAAHPDSPREVFS